MPARVAVVTTFYRPVLGGAESAAERLATYLHRRGHQVVVLTKRTSAAHPAAETIDGVEVVRLPPIGERKGSGKWRVIPSIRRALLSRRGELDAICCIDYRGIGLAALAVRKRLGVPVIFQAQTEGVLSGARVRAWMSKIGAKPGGPMASFATWPIRTLYGRADAIGCISHAIEQEALAAGIPRERVHYLPNPVDTTRFSPASADERRVIRRDLQIPADAVLAVYVGRLSQEKGAMELVQAWAQVRPNARLVLIGPAMPDHPWDVSNRARDFVTAQGLGDVVTFTGGLPADRVAQWLRAADFAVQPSHFEAMGLAAAEEMAAGLPVIASDATGYRDFVTDGETGLIVRAGDIGGLAYAITRLSGDPALRARMGAQARTRAEAFDERVVLERFAQLIDKLAAGG
jgi:glycosyltransferase involved in cell wall biosynthesis